MSPISLDDLAKKHPDLKRALRLLGKWLRKHSDPILVPATLSRQIDGLDQYELASALVLLAKSGLLIKRYKVVTPSGVYADGEFSEVSEIPERLPDRFNNYFDTADADILPIFRREEKI